ncbi:MAG: amidase [Hyphomonadaceae bacterium]
MKSALNLSLAVSAAVLISACAQFEALTGPISSNALADTAAQTVETVEVVETPTPSIVGPAAAMATRNLPEIAAALTDGTVTSEGMVRAYLDRIEKLDRNGPTLRAVLSLNPNALEDAMAADAARAAGETLGPLHGVPVLLKDNIETLDPIATTAGALVLKDNFAERDAPLAAGLRAAGAIILGKTNLSQWANFRSNDSISGWSAMGGQVRNPHMLDRSPCGSSSGSGSATAAALAAATVGTETNGSVICPSTVNGIVGFKPTVGLVAQNGIVPISSTQDTAGPMTRSVRGAAMMLTAMSTGEGATDFTSGLSDTSLQGKRVGVLRFAIGSHPAVAARFEEALAVLTAQGAELVEITELDLPDGYGAGETKVLQVEFKHTLNEYLADAAPAVQHRTLKDVIAFNFENADVELELFDQSIMEASEAQPGIDDPAYLEALELIITASGTNGIDKFLADNNVDVLVAPTFGPSWLIDGVYGDNTLGGAGAGYLAAIAGYPHLTVPMGTVRELPIGLSFMSTAGDDANVLSYGYDYEQASQKIVAPKFHRNLDSIPAVARANRPAGQ